MIENLEALLASGQDNALLRFSLGTALLKNGDAEAAAGHLAEAVRQDPEYSAAWKSYGKALQALGKSEASMRAYENGIAAAGRKGDKQAAKEMQVFLRRLQKAADSQA
jgi:predicted Zn-dependent protease